MNWTEILKTVAPIAGSLIAVYLAYRYAIKKLKQESRENIERKKYEAILSAHQNIYKLLAYTSDTENEKSILVWERSKGERGNTNYFFRKDNILDFLKQLPYEFYHQGNGLFLSSDVSALFFEYRNIVFGFLLATKELQENYVAITKLETANRMQQIHHELSKQIRKSIALLQRNLVSL